MQDPVIPANHEHGTYRVGYLQRARTEGKSILNPVGYAYAVRMAAKLREWGNHEEIRSLRVEKVENYWELKLKGNVIGNTNLRIFFGVFDDHRVVVVLGVYQKDEDDQTPSHIRIRMRNRMREVAARMPATQGKESP